MPNYGFVVLGETWDKAVVRASAVSDVIKVWAWAIGSLAIALCLAPVAFNGGKALAELSSSKDFNGAVNKAAAWSGAAGLEDFFKICWVGAALVLLFPLVEWLRLGRDRQGKTPWRIRLPHGAVPIHANGQPLQSDRWGPLHGLAGFLLAFGCFTVIGIAMIKAGAFAYSGDGAGWRDGLWLDIGSAVLLASLAEVFFRRMVLGVFLRAMETAFAIAMAALMFAGIQFVLSGFGGAAGTDGETLSVLRLTGIVFTGGDVFQRLAVVFFPWFAFGFVLGWARWRTASLWLPTGLLTGWLLADELFSKATLAVPVQDRVAVYFASESVHNGIIPLLGVIAVGGFVHVFTHGLSSRKNDTGCD